MSKKIWKQKSGRVPRIDIPVYGITVALPDDLTAVGTLKELDVKAFLDGGRKTSIRRDEKRGKEESVHLAPEESWARAIANISTNAWRATIKMVDADTGEPKEEMKRVYRHIEAIFESLKGIGIETIDPTGHAYDSGMALKVASFEQTPGLSKEEIKETIKPSVSWQGRLIQMGEVIVGTPQKTTDSERGTDEQNNH